MNEAAVDASLKGVGTAYALNDAFAHGFAGVLDGAADGGQAGISFG